MREVYIKEGGRWNMPGELRERVDFFVNQMPEELGKCLSYIEYTGFSDVQGLTFYFSPVEMKKDNISEEIAQDYIKENAKFGDRIFASCEFKESLTIGEIYESEEHSTVERQLERSGF